LSLGFLARISFERLTSRPRTHGRKRCHPDLYSSPKDNKSDSDPPNARAALLRGDFSSRRTDGDRGYALMAERMMEVASEQPGFLGAESARGDDGFGITISYWSSEAATAAWKAHGEHRSAQDTGKRLGYAVGICIDKCEGTGIATARNMREVSTDLMWTEPELDSRRNLQADALRLAARIAAAEESPLALDVWNRACQRIQNLIEAEAAKLEDK